MDLTDIVESCRVYAPYVIGGVAYIVVLNQVANPISDFLNNIPLWNSTLDYSKLNLKVFENLSPELTALDYLNLSSSIVHNSKHKRKSLCRHKQYDTFKVYQKLIKLNDRKDLRRSLKLAKTYDHCFLEFLDKYGWKPYEPTQYTPELTNETVQDYSERNKDEKQKIESNKPVTSKSIAGTNFLYPTFKSIGYRFGLIGSIIDHFRS